jgi:anaerobic magnesium-protoporphyrin IX monomethyl ester cyclase
MRVLLINPYCPIEENPSPPLGLSFLAGALLEAGVETRALDFAVFPYSRERLETTLKDFQPHMVGATAVTMTYDSAARIIREVKAIDPDILTVMGGPHVTFLAQETMKVLPELDLIVLGEGERTVVALAQEAEKEQNWGRIPGIVFRRGAEIRSTGPREEPIALDSLPMPARHLFPLGRYRALGMALTMTTTRGCPHQCIFCAGRKMVGAKVRYRDPVKVVDELEYLSRLEFPQINIADDLFTASKKHCLAVCQEIKRRNLKTRWTSFSRVDTISMEVLKAMKEAGCTTVSFGVETGNPEILKTIRKGITLEKVVEALRLCREAGLETLFSFILGLPGETPETLRQTVDFSDRLTELGGSCGYHLLAPFPGTEVRDRKDEYGIHILTDDWSQYHANRAIVETPKVNKAMMDEVVMAWEQSYLDHLGRLKDQRAKGEITEKEAWELTKLEHVVAIHDLMASRAVERNGSWPLDGQPSIRESQLERLAENVWSSTRYPQEQVLKSLQYALGEGFLTFSVTAEQVRWGWLDYLGEEGTRIEVKG